MKKFLLATALLAACGVSFAEEAKPAPKAPVAPKAPEEDSETDTTYSYSMLHNLMVDMARDLKLVSKNLTDESAVESNRRLLKSAISAAEKCREHTPITAELQPKDKKAGFIAAYKSEMNKLIANLHKVDESLAKKDFAAAKAALKACKALEKEDHHRFKEKKKK